MREVYIERHTGAELQSNRDITTTTTTTILLLPQHITTHNYP